MKYIPACLTVKTPSSIEKYTPIPVDVAQSLIFQSTNVRWGCLRWPFPKMSGFPAYVRQNNSGRNRCTNGTKFHVGDSVFKKIHFIF
ncbi:hypothetical protein NQ315_015098 [Exocentrus adspersus]|uniref:Uncharacterized protein n=1 Tax=Exocentrus adspersus TaxID=1586481 RepID=A0AAV8VWP7_9CUCU|nr:hypothetical protein NQ315_015098 [Exocentrus adspersus]